MLSVKWPLVNTLLINPMVQSIIDYSPFIFKGLYHQHYVALPVRISLTLSRHPFLLSITSGRSSRLHPISAQNSGMWVLAGHPAFAHPYEGVHRSKSLMSLSLLLQQCPTCLVRLTGIVFMMGDKWPYSSCFVRCCLQDLQHPCIVAIKLFLHIFC